MSSEPFYDPAKTYIDNYEHGPIGHFADTTSNSQSSEPIHPLTEHPEHSDEIKGQAYEL